MRRRISRIRHEHREATMVIDVRPVVAGLHHGFRGTHHRCDERQATLGEILDERFRLRFHLFVGHGRSAYRLPLRARPPENLVVEEAGLEDITATAGPRSNR